MHSKLVYLFLLMLLSFSTPSFAEEDTYTFTSTTQAERFNHFTKNIRCVVCLNQSIADSNAPLANDLRNKIYNMMLDNQSDADIQDYLVKRYGEFILFKPRFSKLTIILWGFPFIALAGILCMLVRVFRHPPHPSV